MKLPWYFKLSYFFCLPAALLAATSALAEDLPTYSATGPEGKVTLTAEPCTQHIWLAGWQIARWMWRGKAYEACWRMQRNGGEQLVVILDSSGEVATFYPTQFVKDEAI